MTKIEKFYQTATDSEWETMAALRKETGKDPAKISSFKAQYGFTPDSIRPYELMHFHELEKQRQAAQDLEKLKERNAALQCQIESLRKRWVTLPPCRMMEGERIKASFYATKESLERFDRAADRVSEKYGYKKYLAAAFILEELLTRFTDE